jgi:hypothetical protein
VTLPTSGQPDYTPTELYLRRQLARRPRELRRLNRRLQFWLRRRDEVLRELEQIAGAILTLDDGPR